MMGKIQKQFHLLWGALLMFGLLHMCNADGAEFLGMHQRFSDSNSYDSYYSCNSCGAFLLWSFDEIEVVFHLTSRSQLGDVIYREYEVNASPQQFYSMVLGLRPVGSEMCMDVVLIVTQTRSDWRPVVTCENNNRNVSVQGGDRMETPDSTNDPSTSITVNHPIANQRDVVDPNRNFLTQILVCRSNDDLLRWSNRNFSSTFNGFAASGSHEPQIHPSDSTIALYNAVFLKKTGNEIISAIAWTDYESVGSYYITCHSSNDQVSIMVNAEVTTKEPTSSEATMPDSTTPDSMLDSTTPSVDVDTSLPPVMSTQRNDLSVAIIIVPCIIVVILVLVSPGVIALFSLKRGRGGKKKESKDTPVPVVYVSRCRDGKQKESKDTPVPVYEIPDIKDTQVPVIYVSRCCDGKQKESKDTPVLVYEIPDIKDTPVPVYEIPDIKDTPVLVYGIVDMP